MFDMMKIGKTLASLRKEKNMTQVELADLLGISYQAVSNWERGDSMPDISKLSELSEIFGVSIDYLLDNDKKTVIIKEFLSNDTPAIDSFEKEDLGDVLPLVKPSLVKESVSKSEKPKSLDLLVSLAPFLDDDSLAELVEDVSIDNIDSIVSLAPFLSSDSLSTLAKKLESIDSSLLASIAPFMDSDDLGDLCKKHINNEDFTDLVSLAPFLDEDDLDELVIPLFESKGIDACIGLVPFLGDDGIESLLEKAVEQEDFAAISQIAPFAESDSLLKALKKVNRK